MCKKFISWLSVVAVILFIVSTSLQAGTKGKISGTVIDEFGETLVGVQVFVEGTTKGTVTDVNGKYRCISIYRFRHS
jgi:hypothetical protein